LPQTRDIATAATSSEPSSFREIRSVSKGSDEPWYFSWIGRSIRVNHRDYIACGRFKATRKRIAFTLPGLSHNAHVGPKLSGYFHGTVNRLSVNQDDLVSVPWDSRENIWDISFLIECRNDYRHFERSHQESLRFNSKSFEQLYSEPT
jgi:hypothetical protein